MSVSADYAAVDQENGLKSPIKTGKNCLYLLGVEGESAGIVERHDVGVVFEPENAVALCSRLNELRSDDELLARLKRNGPKAAVRFDRTVLANSMLQRLQEVVDRWQKPGKTAGKSDHNE